MDLIPAFEIGLWNAWIFIIPLVIGFLIGRKFLFVKRMPESPQDESIKDKIISITLILLMFFLYVYAIFLPLQLWTIWFYIGLILYFMGMVMVIVTMVHFATTPEDEPVTKGLYRFSRNPMFIAFFIVYTAIGIACTSWLYLLVTLIFILVMVIMSPIEEKMTLDHYGKPYEEYMERTPKWIGIPGSKKR
jgi:protein-S-isoprenylcysteine O-methyltransferase Ste14